MVDVVVTNATAGARPKLDVRPNMVAVILFLALLASGVLFTGHWGGSVGRFKALTQ